MDKFLMFEIEKQKNVIAGYCKTWQTMRLDQLSASAIKKWLYEVHYYLVYHFYTQVQLMGDCEELKRDILHEQSELLTKIYAVLSSDESVEQLELHMTSLIDRDIEDYIDRHQVKNKSGEIDKQNEYFRPSYLHSAFIIVYLKKGYYGTIFGQLTLDALNRFRFVTSRYISSFDEEWYRFSDLTHWEYATLETVQSASLLNSGEASKGRKYNCFYCRDKSLSQFLIDQIIEAKETYCVVDDFDTIVADTKFKDLLESEVIGVEVLGAEEYITGHFESKENE